MPVQPPVSYPGVYIQEVESNVRTIVPVPTANIAFVGRARRGPVNRPIICHNFGDFEGVFGGLWEKSKLAHAVRDFFNNGGATAIVVRVFALTAAQKAAVAATQIAEDSEAKANDTAAQSANKTPSAFKASDSAKTASDQADAAVVAAQKALDDANAALNDAKTKATGSTAADKAQDPAVVAAQAAADKAKDTLGAAQTAQADAQAAASLAQTSADKAAAADKTLAAKAKEDAQKAVGAAQTTATKKATEDQLLAALLPLVSEKITLQALEPGAWSKELKAELSWVEADDVSTDVAKRLGAGYDQVGRATANNKFNYLTNVFNLKVSDGVEGGVTETYNMLTLGDTTRRLDRVLAQQSRLVKVDGEIASDAAIPQPTFDNVGKQAPLQVAVSNKAQLDDGAPLNATDLIGSLRDRSGMYALETVNFNMLIFPDGQFDDNGNPSSDLVDSATKYCADRRAMLLLDSPPGLWDSVEGAKAGYKNYVSWAGDAGKNAAYFFPRLKKANPLRDGQIEDFSPLGSIAGVMARTDATRGVWKAAAGLDAVIGGVVGLTTALTDAQNGELNPLGINCLRSMPSGNVIWGARTLKGDDRLANQWKYIPVRRTALLIEESLYQGTQWAVFEPNDEPLWSQLRLNIGSFMHELFRQGAFQGSSPKDAYFVECGPNTTTQADIDKGIVNIYVGFAPLKPAEFVVLYIQQKAGTPAV